MRALPIVAALLLVPLAGCFHAVSPAGVAASTLDAEGYKKTDSRSETRFGIAKVEVRTYERSSLTEGYATLSVVTVTDVPILTPRAVEAAANDALSRANAVEGASVKIDFSKAGAGTVDAKGFTVEQSGQKGKGFRAEFACTDGYVLVVGLGADLPIPGGSGNSMFDSVVKLAKSVGCTDG